MTHHISPNEHRYHLLALLTALHGVPNFGSVENFIHIKDEISLNVCSKYGLKEFEVKSSIENILLHMPTAHASYVRNVLHHGSNARFNKVDFHIGATNNQERKLSEIILATILLLFLQRDSWGVYNVNKSIMLNEIDEQARNVLEITSKREYGNLIDDLFNDVETFKTLRSTKIPKLA